MISFSRSGGEPTIKHVRPPIVFVSPQALEDMGVIVAECDTEVGWLGTVEVTEERNFVIREIFLPLQGAHGATTEINGEGFAAIAQELMQRENGVELLNSIRFWGHSHVNMGLLPSQQDEEQLSKLLQSTEDFFIAARANKSGGMRFDVLYANGLQVDNAPWQPMVASTDRAETMKALIKERVQPIQSEVVVYKGGAVQYGFHNSRSHADEWSEKEWAAFLAAQSGELVVGDNVGGPARTTTETLPRLLDEDEQEVVNLVTDAENGDVDPGDVTFVIELAMEAALYPLEYFAPLSIESDKPTFVDWCGRTRPIDEITGLELEAAGYSLQVAS